MSKRYMKSKKSALTVPMDVIFQENYVNEEPSSSQMFSILSSANTGTTAEDSSEHVPVIMSETQLNPFDAPSQIADHQNDLEHPHEAQNYTEDIMMKRRLERSPPKPRKKPKAPSERDLIMTALLEYGKEHGHYNVPPDVMYECVLPGRGPNGGDFIYSGPLGQWLHNEKERLVKAKGSRAMYERGVFLQMAADGKLNFDIDEHWRISLAALKRYCEEHGHCNIPQTQSYKCSLPGLGENGTDLMYDGKLGQWLDLQRKHKRGWKGSEPMPTEREQQLQQLVDQGLLYWDALNTNISFKNKQLGDVTWPRHFAALLKYKEQVGHCNIPRDQTFQCTLPGMGEGGEDLAYDGKLGRWLEDQRRLKKGTDGNRKLTPERHALLQELVDQGALVWDASAFSASNRSKRRGDITWPRHYAALLKYCEETGSCNIPSGQAYQCVLPGLAEDGGDLQYSGKLGQWLMHQKCLKHGTRGAARLSPEREALLQGLVDQGLLQWDSSSERVSERSKQLSDVTWPRHFAALLKYCEVHGHCNIPRIQSYQCVLPGMGDGGTDLHYDAKLGRWLDSQRQKKKGAVGSVPLTTEREALLDELFNQGLLLWDVSLNNPAIKSRHVGELTWPRHFAALIKYCEEHGHCNVPRNQSYDCVLPGLEEDGSDVKYSGKLGKWLDTQRQKKNGIVGPRLATDREAQLQELVDRGLLVWECSSLTSSSAAGSGRLLKQTYVDEQEWPTNFAALVKYGEQYGHCNVPRNQSFACVLPIAGEGGSEVIYEGRLGEWLHRQKRAKRSNNPNMKLPPEFEAQLQSLVNQSKWVISTN